jgi:hypothetical protein
MVVHVALDRPENAGVLDYLGRGRGLQDLPVGQPSEEVDRWHLGTHPDVVERLWDALDAALPQSGRCVIFGGPALVNPVSGIVLAVGIGTQYALRLLPGDLALAIDAGAEIVHVFQTSGGRLDLAATFGPGWAFGRFDARETDWLAATYAASASFP